MEGSTSYVMERKPIATVGGAFDTVATGWKLMIMGIQKNDDCCSCFSEEKRSADV